MAGPSIQGEHRGGKTRCRVPQVEAPDPGPGAVGRRRATWRSPSWSPTGPAAPSPFGDDQTFPLPVEHLTYTRSTARVSAGGRVRPGHDPDRLPAGDPRGLPGADRADRRLRRRRPGGHPAGPAAAHRAGASGSRPSEVEEAVTTYRALYPDVRDRADRARRPGAVEALAAVRERGLRVVVVTSKLGRLADLHLRPPRPGRRRAGRRPVRRGQGGRAGRARRPLVRRRSRGRHGRRADRRGPGHRRGHRPVHAPTSCARPARRTCCPT